MWRLLVCLLGLVGAKPHVLFLLADDMGWANIGFHRLEASTLEERQGQLEVQTPTIDELAQQGVLLERHYSYRICGPARSALLSGRVAPHVLVKNVGVTARNPSDPVSGYSGIPRNMTGMGQKLKQGGYRTHYTGKWDAGMATPQHTPYGRGFESSLHYYQHANDYWNKRTGLVATGLVTMCLNVFYDIMVENDTYRGPYDGPELTDACQTSLERTPPCYEEKIFEEHSLKIIAAHNASDVDHPLFLFHAFHLLHSPLQVPIYYYDLIEREVLAQGGQAFDSENRRLIMAMTRYMDDTVRNLTEAFKAKGMWENTLVVFTTDNGGPIYEPGSANNHPLRGGKYSDFEGGVRTTTFISGGYVPAERRGQTHNGLVSSADWYTIFSELAGVDPEDIEAKEANKWLEEQNLTLLPPIDGKKGQLEAIFSGAQGPRAGEPLFLSSTALLDLPYKLVTGIQPYMRHTGPLYPNCSTITTMVAGGGPDFCDIEIFGETIEYGNEWEGDCGNGCLFNVVEDPSEYHDLSHDPAYKARLEQMISTLAEYNKTLFEPDRGETHLPACYSAMLNGGGHYGPFVYIEDYYTNAPRTFGDLSQTEQTQMYLMTAVGLNTPLQELAQRLSPAVLRDIQNDADRCCPGLQCDGNYYTLYGLAPGPAEAIELFSNDSTKNLMDELAYLRVSCEQGAGR